MLNGTGKNRIIFITILLILSVASLTAEASAFTAELQKDKVWLGESVRLTLYLQGSEEAIAPELIIQGIKVTPIGGTVNSSRSITNINGKVTETISKAYVYGYLLTPEKDGQFIIPSIKVIVDGHEISTNTLMLNVEKPGTSEDFKLKLEFDRDKVYINEECRLKISFLYNLSLKALEIKIPGLESISHENIIPRDRTENYEININGSPVIFKQDDQNGFAGLSAVFSIRSDESRLLVFENATASFGIVTGYQKVRDFFGRIQNQEVYGEKVIAGNPAALNILPFPDKDRPDDFFGLSGDIALDLSIDPPKVHIGDPITLTLKVSGMNNPDVRIPVLKSIIGAEIDVPDTRSSGQVNGRTKTITQTVRVNSASVEEIPAIRFSYFDTESGSYKHASSAPVPITVLDTKIITAADLEGGTGKSVEKQKVLLEKTREGIYHNYTGMKVIKSQRRMIEKLGSSILIRFLLIIPPVIFAFILIFTSILPQIRQEALKRVDRTKAVRKLKKDLRKTQTEDSGLFLKDFNLQLAEFLKTYGTEDDSVLIRSDMEIINRTLYGAAFITIEEALAAARRILKSLEDREAVNA